MIPIILLRFSKLKVETFFDRISGNPSWSCGHLIEIHEPARPKRLKRINLKEMNFVNKKIEKIDDLFSKFT